MRDLNVLNGFRMVSFEREYYGCNGGATCGAFEIASCVDKKNLRIIASAGEGWDHVSVSRADRIPTWTEMEQVAKLFFNDDEIAVQFHVPASQHVNVHPHVLHWWRPNENSKMPQPPRSMIA